MLDLFICTNDYAPFFVFLPVIAKVNINIKMSSLTCCNITRVIQCVHFIKEPNGSAAALTSAAVTYRYGQ